MASVIMGATTCRKILYNGIVHVWGTIGGGEKNVWPLIYVFGFFFKCPRHSYSGMGPIEALQFQFHGNLGHNLNCNSNSMRFNSNSGVKSLLRFQGIS